MDRPEVNHSEIGSNRWEGHHNIGKPYARLYRDEPNSRGPDSTSQNPDRYQAKAGFMRQHVGENLIHDPNYNPGFSRGLYNFELAWPPYTVN